MSTKRTATSHLNCLNTKKAQRHMTLEIQAQAQKCDKVKPVNRIPTSPASYLDLQWQYIYKQTMNKNLHRFSSTQTDHIYVLSQKRKMEIWKQYNMKYQIIKNKHIATYEHCYNVQCFSNLSLSTGN